MRCVVHTGVSYYYRIRQWRSLFFSLSSRLHDGRTHDDLLISIGRGRLASIYKQAQSHRQGSLLVPSPMIDQVVVHMYPLITILYLHWSMK